MTFAFPKYEWYCVECGHRYGMFGPQSKDATPKLRDRYIALKTEWDRFAGSRIITPNAWYGPERCSQCDPDHPHIDHATKAEIQDDADARRWLKERVNSGG
jgi:hypothetical protein